MRLFPPPLEIGAAEGFTPEKDIFGRRALGAGLTNLLNSVTDPTVIAVDGQWGSGKTTFLKMWAGELRKAGFPVVYFDAFESDYVDDAFLAIAGEIIALLKERKKADTMTGKRLIEGAVSTGKVLLRSGLKLGVKAATLGAIAAADLQEVASDLATEASTLADKYLGELLTKQKQQKQTIQGFRDALAELPGLLVDAPSQATGESPEPKPLIFVIDELDRCRPTFALEILERMKHFFSVPNVHFVLGVHLGQLRNSVAVAYGADIDAQTYLQKFIQLTLHLIDRARHRSDRAAIKFIDYLGRRMDIKNDDLLDLIRHVAEHRDLSLRAIEQIMTTLAIALAYGSDRYEPSILSGLFVLKAVEPGLYQDAKRGRLRYPEVAGALRLSDSWENETNGQYTLKVWEFFSADMEATDAENRARELGYRGSRDRLGFLSSVANDVIDRLTKA